MLSTAPTPETVGSIRLDPPGPFVAGSRHTLILVYTAGPSGLDIGGALRIFPPHRGHTFWELGHVTARCSRPESAVEVETFNDRPYSFHHSKFPYVRVTVYGAPLEEGDTITVTLGDPGGYSKGFFRRARVADLAWHDYRFEVLVDVLGNGDRPRELDRPDAFVALPDPPRVAIIPDRPARLHVVARPPGRADDNDFDLVISVRDQFGNLAEYEGTLAIESTDPGAELPESIALGTATGCYDLCRPERPMGIARAEGCRLSTERARVTAYSARDELIGTSNVIAPAFGAPYRVYFGDLHVMTGWLGKTMLGDTEYAYRWARDVQGLDFSVVTNAGREDHWAEDLALDDAYNEPGRFATIPALERGFRRGHKNTYFRTSEGVPPMPALDIEEMFEWLAELGVPAMTIAHHPNCHSETSRYYAWGPQDWSTVDPRFERLAEICQCRGSFEVDEVGGPVSLGGLGASIQDALALGHRLGFVGGTDNHNAQPGSPRSNLGGLDADEIIGGGITGVFARELTREAIFDALWARRCYATTSRRILLDVRMGEHMMGGDLSAEQAAPFADERSLRIEAIGERDLARIEVVRNNVTVESVEVDGDEATVTYTDPTPLAEVPAVSEVATDVVFYYVRVIQADDNLAWSSPIWLAR